MFIRNLVKKSGGFVIKVTNGSLPLAIEAMVVAVPIALEEKYARIIA
jgi:hypothetical protein